MGGADTGNCRGPLFLGVGMAVDANIITYERIKESFETPEIVRSAFRSRNRQSFAIFIANMQRSSQTGHIALYFRTAL